MFSLLFLRAQYLPQPCVFTCMKGLFHLPVELIMVIVAVTVVAGEGRLVDRIVGMPSATDRLAVAAGAGDVESFDAALRDGADPAGRTINGDTPLHCAADAGEAELAHRLIHLGADVNLPNHHGLTPLMCAASWDHPKAVQLLLEHGADPRIRARSTGATALDIAVTADVSQTIKVLKDWMSRGSHAG
jgi:hypothetical protein